MDVTTCTFNFLHGLINSFSTSKNQYLAYMDNDLFTRNLYYYQVSSGKFPQSDIRLIQNITLPENWKFGQPNSSDIECNLRRPSTAVDAMDKSLKNSPITCIFVYLANILAALYML